MPKLLLDSKEKSRAQEMVEEKEKCECISGKYQPFGRWIFDLVIYVCAFKEHFVFLYLFYPHNFGIVFKIKKNQRKGSSFSLFFA